MFMMILVFRVNCILFTYNCNLVESLVIHYTLFISVDFFRKPPSINVCGEFSNSGASICTGI